MVFAFCIETNGWNSGLNAKPGCLCRPFEGGECFRSPVFSVWVGEERTVGEGRRAACESQ